jgi:hypothetical protein
MPNQRIVMPLLNKKVTTFKGPPWYFDNRTFLATIYVEDHGAFFSKADERYIGDIKIDTKCIYVDDPEFDNFRDFAKTISAKLKFALNNFSSDAPVLLPYAALLNVNDRTRKSRVIEVVDLEAVANLRELRKQAYKVRVGSTSEGVSGLYKVLDEACRNNSAAIFTLERFNTCLTRANILDQIVDASISLESLISGNAELSFRFALYHSFISEVEPDKRSTAFEHFKNLYSARSGVVHGDVKEKVMNKVINNWQEVMRLTRASINYYLLFLFLKDPKDWDEHLRRLVLGLDKPITTEEVTNE